MVLPYMVTFIINIPQILAYIPYMDPSWDMSRSNFHSWPLQLRSILHPHLEPHPLSFHHASLETARTKTGKLPSALKIRWIRWISRKTWRLVSINHHTRPTLCCRRLSGWWLPNHLEKYEFVNGKDDIPYMKWKIKNVWTHQPVAIWIILHLRGCFIEQPAQLNRCFSLFKKCWFSISDDSGSFFGNWPTGLCRKSMKISQVLGASFSSPIWDTKIGKSLVFFVEILQETTELFVHRNP